MDIDFCATQPHRRIDGGRQQADGRLRNESRPLRIQNQHLRLGGGYRRKPVQSQLIRRDLERNSNLGLPSRNAKQTVQLPVEPRRALFIDPQLRRGDSAVYR